MVNCIKCPLFALGYNSNIIGRLGDFIKFYGKIPDIFVLITGHFGLFKTSTLRLREAGKTQAQSQTWRLNISKTDFKSVRKTIPKFKIFSKSIKFSFMCISYHNNIINFYCVRYGHLERHTKLFLKNFCQKLKKFTPKNTS